MEKQITYNKLIRDNIPDIILKNNNVKSIKTIKLDDISFYEALILKLQEETNECVQALDSNNKQAITEELVDLQEVIIQCLKFSGITKEEFKQMRKNKLSNKGGFENRTYLEYVEYKE